MGPLADYTPAHGLRHDGTVGALALCLGAAAAINYSSGNCRPVRDLPVCRLPFHYAGTTLCGADVLSDLRDDEAQCLALRSVLLDLSNSVEAPLHAASVGGRGAGRGTGPLHRSMATN